MTGGKEEPRSIKWFFILFTINLFSAMLDVHRASCTGKFQCFPFHVLSDTNDI